MNKLLILIISISILFSCLNNDDNDTSDIDIRLSNVSQFDYKNIIVNTSIENVHYKNLGSGQSSDFKNFERAYRHAFIELQIDGKTYTLQPVDYFGETILENGKYTYQIDANDSQEQYGKLALTLIEE